MNKIKKKQVKIYQEMTKQREVEFAVEKLQCLETAE